MTNANTIEGIINNTVAKFAKTKTELGEQLHRILVELPLGKYEIGGCRVEVVKMEAGMSEWNMWSRRNDYKGFGYGVLIDGALCFDDFYPYSDNTPHSVYNACVMTKWSEVNWVTDTEDENEGGYFAVNTPQAASIVKMRQVVKGLPEFITGWNAKKQAEIEAAQSAAQAAAEIPAIK